MQILAIDTMSPDVEDAQLRPHLPEELAATVKLYLNETIRNFYFRKDRPGVVFIMESDSLETARATLNRLPLVEVGLLDFELIPIGPLMPLANLVPGLEGTL